MEQIVEIVAGWQLGAHIGLLEVDGGEHSQRRSEQKHILYWENQLQVFIVDSVIARRGWGFTSLLLVATLRCREAWAKKVHGKMVIVNLIFIRI